MCRPPSSANEQNILPRIEIPGIVEANGLAAILIPIPFCCTGFPEPPVPSTVVSAAPGGLPSTRCWPTVWMHGHVRQPEASKPASATERGRVELVPDPLQRAEGPNPLAFLEQRVLRRAVLAAHCGDIG